MYPAKRAPRHSGACRSIQVGVICVVRRPGSSPGTSRPSRNTQGLASGGHPKPGRCAGRGAGPADYVSAGLTRKRQTTCSTHPAMAVIAVRSSTAACPQSIHRWRPWRLLRLDRPIPSDSSLDVPTRLGPLPGWQAVQERSIGQSQHTCTGIPDSPAIGFRRDSPPRAENRHPNSPPRFADRSAGSGSWEARRPPTPEARPPSASAGGDGSVSALTARRRVGCWGHWRAASRIMCGARS